MRRDLWEVRDREKIGDCRRKLVKEWGEGKNMEVWSIHFSLFNSSSAPFSKIGFKLLVVLMDPPPTSWGRLHTRHIKFEVGE